MSIEDIKRKISQKLIELGDEVAIKKNLFNDKKLTDELINNLTDEFFKYVIDLYDPSIRMTDEEYIEKIALPILEQCKEDILKN